MLMLSASDAAPLFSGLRAVIVDEVHSFAASKRGDFTALALSRLSALAPQAIRTGLSATVADPAALAAWLGPTGAPASVLQSGLRSKPDIRILVPEDASIPYGGFMARYAVPTIYEAIRKAGTSIVFVNTRAQAELMLQMLWDANEDNLPIATLSRLARPRTPAAHRSHDGGGEIRSVVATAALELGIDWGDVDLVIQVAAPKGVAGCCSGLGARTTAWTFRAARFSCRRTASRRWNARRHSPPSSTASSTASRQAPARSMWWRSTS